MRQDGRHGAEAGERGGFGFGFGFRSGFGFNSGSGFYSAPCSGFCFTGRNAADGAAR